MEHNVLFKTVHGSRLYGLSHIDSDYDYYTVVEKVHTNRATYSTHEIVDGVDSVVVDFGTWQDQCIKGVPQALEAMFARHPYVMEDKIADFREGFRVGTGVYDTYLRTIKSFAMQDDFKHKRHALRLAVNMKDMRKWGRFNPTLNRIQVQVITSLAKLPCERVYDDAMLLAWSGTDVVQ